MKNKYSFIFLFLLIVQTSLLSASDYGMPFLLIPTNARNAAVSGSLNTLSEGIECLNSNPALLSKVKIDETGFTGSRFFDDRYLSTLSWAHPLPKGGFALEAAYINLGYIDKTTLTSGLNNQILGTESSNDLIFNFGYGFDWKYGLSVGGGMKFFTEKLTDERASGVGFDAGLLYKSPIPDVLFALTVRNIGRRTLYESDYENMPTSYTLGASYTAFENKLRFMGDVIKNRHDDVNVQLGFEAKVMENLFLRFGINPDNEAKQKFSLGFGFVIDQFQIDYSIVPADDFDVEQYITLKYDFLKPQKENETLDIDYLINRAKKRVKHGWYKMALNDIIKVMEIEPTNEESLNLSIRLRKVIKILQTND